MVAYLLVELSGKKQFMIWSNNKRNITQESNTTLVYKAEDVLGSTTEL